MFREVTYTPENAAFTIAGTAPADSTLDDILSALKDLNLQARDLVGISSATNRIGPPVGEPIVSYLFRVTVPYTQMRGLQERIAATRRALTEAPSKILIGDVSTSIGPTAASIELARQRVLPDLIADARKRADAIARAASLGLGAIVTANDISIPTAVFRSGDFGLINNNVSSILTEPATLSVCFAVR